MSNMMADGMEFLKSQLEKHVSSSDLTYHRGDSEIDITAVIGSTLLQLSDDQGGIKMQRTERDFIVPAECLCILGDQIFPERGDLVKETVDESVNVYKVLPVGTEAPWRWADPHQEMMRIHTKKVGVE